LPSFGLNRFKFGQDRSLIAQDRQQVEAIEPQRGIVDHHHHAGVTIKEGLERRGCRDERIGKGLIRPLLSQWLQLLQSCEQILLTGGLELFGLNYIAGHKLIACQITFFGKLRCPLHHRLDGIQLTAVPKSRNS